MGFDMTKQGNDVFQGLYLRAQLTPVSIRNCILDQLRKPWFHDTLQEKHVKGPSAGADVIALGCDACEELPAASLVLLQTDNGYKLKDITLRDGDERYVEKFNKILQHFVIRVVEPASQVGKFSIDFSLRECAID